MGTCADTVAAAAGRSPASGLQNPEPASAPQSVSRLFEQQANQRPDGVALIFEDRRCTYGELNARANRIAGVLRRRGVGPESIVALRLERSPDMIAAILGVLNAGGAYLPIDPAYPPARQQFMLQDANVRWVLTQASLPPLEHQAEMLLVDSDRNFPADETVAETFPQPDANDLAYVIYTSGSTGKPKGVLVTHGNLLNSTRARFEYYREPVANFLLLSSYAFDSSVAGIFWTLCQGGTLTLPHEYSRQTASELADLIARHRVSHLLCLPSLYAVLLEQAPALASLRVAIVAGETCSPALVKRHHERLPHCALYNEYGPTEAAVWSTVHRCEPRDASRRVPIGRPIPGAEVYLLDERLEPVRDGEAGELCVGGAGVARGYLNQPALTAEKFVSCGAGFPACRFTGLSTPVSERATGKSPEPADRNVCPTLYRTGDLARRSPDGTIEFLGRRDEQLKIRGHRIEPAEIEAALREHEAVADVVVIARDSNVASSLRLEIRPQAEHYSDSKPINGTNGASTPSARRQLDDFEVAVHLKHDAFLRPPRPSQRVWLLDRALDEFAEDLRALDLLAKRFVPGADPELNTLIADREHAELSEQDILEDWHIPLMQEMARAVTETQGDILELGFGRGVASTFLQECGARSHTIVECNDSVIQRFFEPWRQRFADRDIRLVRGKWQDVIDTLGTFDGIFFQTFPLNEREFEQYLSRSITFAEHFFPVAARHLKPGGAFTYLTHEIDSLSRRHQRLIFQHFRSLTLSVQPLKLPPDCRDLWWADSMVVVKAIK